METFKSVTPDTFTVMFLLDKSIAVAQGDRLATEPHAWWLARLKVEPGYRRKGYGTRLLEVAKELLQGKADRLIVCPGGYDIPWEDQVAFYEANGFKRVGAKWELPLNGAGGGSRTPTAEATGS